MRLQRMNPDGLKQDRCGDVVSMRNEWNRHPLPDRLGRRPELPRVPAGPVGKDECAGDRQHEGESDNQRAPPRFGHNPI